MTDDKQRRRAEKRLLNMADKPRADLPCSIRTREIPGAGRQLEWRQITDPDGAVRIVTRIVDAPDQPMVVTMAVPHGVTRIMRTLLESDGAL